MAYPTFKGIRKWDELVTIIQEINSQKLKIRNKKTKYLVMEIEPVYLNTIANGIREVKHLDYLVGVAYENHEETSYQGQIQIKNLHRFWEVVNINDHE